MKSAISIAIVILTTTSIILIFFSSPRTVKSIQIEMDSNMWNKEITGYIMSAVKPGMHIDSTEYVRKNIESLPWVKKCSIKFLRGNLKIDILTVKPEMAIFYKGHYYIIGENRCLLKKQKNKPKNLQTFFYKGDEPFYKQVNGSYKVKDDILLEIELVLQRLSKENPLNEKPEIILTDKGIKLIYMKNRVIVLIGNSGNSWKNFIKFFKMEKKPVPNTYDFRFSGLLVLKGRNCNG